jgi:hypothetical protein
VNEVTVEGRPWGLCYVYGCPLLGVVGHSAGDGKWFCFCHLNMPSSVNDEITMALNGPDLDFIVKTTLEIRACGSSFFDHPNTYRRIQERLRAAGRPDLLLSADLDSSPHNPGKPVVKMWLMRLERELIDNSTDPLKREARSTAAKTKPVIGPAHSNSYSPYARGDN